jgi:hypothetical protein
MANNEEPYTISFGTAMVKPGPHHDAMPTGQGLIKYAEKRRKATDGHR